MTERVDESIRRRNSLAVKQRDAWRTRYKLLARSIQVAKHRVRTSPMDHAVKLELEGLQSLAQIMMCERSIITMDLQDSAYRWV